MAWGDRKGESDFIRLAAMLSPEYVVVMVGLSSQKIKKLPSNVIGIEHTENVEDAKTREDSWLESECKNFQGIFMKGIPVGDDCAFCPEIISIIKNGKYDIIIVGAYYTPTGMMAILTDNSLLRELLWDKLLHVEQKAESPILVVWLVIWSASLFLVGVILDMLRRKTIEKWLSSGGAYIERKMNCLWNKLKICYSDNH